MHNHSARSFELLETPIACIDIASPHEDFIENMEFRISFK